MSALRTLRRSIERYRKDFNFKRGGSKGRRKHRRKRYGGAK